jgi:hypothetical protein
MATFIADSPPAASNGQAPPEGTAAPPPEPSAAAPAFAATPAPAPAPAEHACAKCGAAMVAGQDWCIQCGAGAPGSLGTPGWRSTATVLVAVAVLVLGAAAAAYAALSKGSGKARVVTVASTVPPAATTPAATAPATTAPGTAATTPGATATTPPSSSLTTPAKPPKIPLSAATPKASEKTTTTGSTTTSTSTTTSSTPTSTTPASSTTGGSTAPESIVLDTNAASPYNPYEYPASWFGDPSLAIDGSTTTIWTAEVNPATAPKMAEGLLIDLKAKQKVAAMELITSTPGMTVQVYGTSAATAPSSITDPSWTPLSAPRVVKKKHKHIALRDSAKQFTFITLWISKAPESAVGTPEAPGHVDVNEVELFPPTS